MEIGEFERDFDALFNPASIAVVGASNFFGKWGYSIPMNIIGGGYRGTLFMVNPKETSVLGLPCYRTLADIGHAPDLVIVTIPARAVLGVVDEAAAMGVHNMLVVASNFSEAGAEGAELERQLARKANEAGITIVGPNTMGVFSASSSLSALGTSTFPEAGRVGFISQSGNLGVQLLEWGKDRGVGFSRFVGSGNAANTGMAEYLEFLGDDPDTELIALYMEGLDEGRRFLQVAAGITPRKPVIVLKGGKGKQGRRAVSSHTGALAGSLELFHGMFEQAGIVTVETSEEFIDLVTAFSALPLPRGGRTVVVTMGGGWGVVAADACDREGVELVDLPQSLIEELDTFLPAFWSRGNPVDLVGNRSRASHFRAIDAITRCESVDTVILMGAMLGKQFFLEFLVGIVVRPLWQMLWHNPRQLVSFMGSLRRGFMKSVAGRKTESKEGSAGINPTEAWRWTDYALINHLEHLIAETGKPIIAVAMSEQLKTTSHKLERHGVLTTPTPERAVHAAAELARYRTFVDGKR